jgi:hypothetical protein
MLRKCSAVLGFLLVVVASLPTQAAMLTFEELPHSDELQGAGNTVFSKGYLLTYAPAPNEPYPVGFTTVGPTWQFNKRSAALAANSCSATTTLTAQDNNPFTLESIDLAELNGDADVSVAFSGITSSGETVQKLVLLRDRKTWQRMKFPESFRNLQSVAWLQGDCIANFPHMFDNIRVFPSWKGKNNE